MSIQLKSEEAVSSLLSTATINRMCRAMLVSGLINVVKTKETVIATIQGDKEVFRALRGPGGRWITRYHVQLFT